MKLPNLFYANLVLLLLASQISTGLSFDIDKCLTGLERFQPILHESLHQSFEEDPNSYLQDLKFLNNHFKQVALECGVKISSSASKGNAQRCKQDVQMVSPLLHDLSDQMEKSIENQNFISMVIIMMSLAENIPKTIQDCGLRV